MHKPIHTYDYIFRQNYYISYGIPLEEFRKSVKHYLGKKWNLNDFNPGEMGRCVYFENKYAEIIWIWTRVKKPYVLAHECLHAAYYALNMGKNIKLDDNSQEVYCYLVEMLMKKTLERG